MSASNEKIRALSLLSGGLDSQLAICVLKDQDIGVEAITFESPFFSPDKAIKAAAGLGVVLRVVDFTAEIMGLIENPKHGFGGGMNPCIDCHALMIKKAGIVMKEKGFHFLSTGEVLNQRPMSQNMRSLAIVAEDSGVGDFLLRPMSAKRLAETEPEKRGWVDRSRLLGLDGRNRLAQFKLAEHYGLKDYPQPAGGCRLTEPNFCRRLKDLKEHEGLSLEAVRLLRTGRHFRLADRVRLIVGREEAENQLLDGLSRTGDIYLSMDDDTPGPTCLLLGNASEEHISLSASICAGYSDFEAGKTARVRVESHKGIYIVEASPAPHENVEAMRV